MVFFLLQGELIHLKKKKNKNIKVGQKNYELLNKAPNYVFWGSLWQTDYALKDYLYLDFFIKNILNIILTTKISQFFFKKLNTNNFLYLFDTFEKLNFKDLDTTASKFNPYFSKFWFLSYKSWLILTFFLFYPSGRVDDVFFLSKNNLDSSNLLFTPSYFFFYNNFINTKTKTLFLF